MEFFLRRHARTRRITLSVTAKGTVRVTAPKLVPRSIVDTFVRAKKEWIEAMQVKLKTEQKPFSGREYSYHANKARAKKVISDRVKYFAEIFGFSYNRISVKNTSTRWGSCSSHDNLNFSYKLLFLPDRLRDYVVVHELCHLREHNHSKKFWAEVAGILPDYRERERELKKYRL